MFLLILADWPSTDAYSNLKQTIRAYAASQPKDFKTTTNQQKQLPVGFTLSFTKNLSDVLLTIALNSWLHDAKSGPERIRVHSYSASHGN